MTTKATNKRRTFRVTVSRTVEIAVDQAVIDQGLLPDNPIQKNSSERGVLEHLAFNLVGNGLRLSQIDGYANRKDDEVHVPWLKYDIDEIEEIEPPNKPTKKGPER